MKTAVLVCVLALGFGASLQGTITCFASDAAQNSSAQNRVVGEVTAIDSASRQFTIKTDAGPVVVIAPDAASILRIPQGETSPEKATKITFAEIAAGDRLFARGELAADGKSMTARQIVVMSTGTTTSDQERRRAEFRARGIAGRVTEINPAKNEIVLLARQREGVGTVTLDTSGKVRFYRYAPDSLNLNDAKPSSFSELRIGDQLRALGEKSADGMRFVPEEIISGSFARVGGTVTAIDSAANQILIKGLASGKSVTVDIGKRSAVRRIPPEVATAFEQSRRDVATAVDSRRTSDRSASDRSASDRSASDRSASDRSTERSERPARSEMRSRTRNRGFQETLESLPPLALSDLKKGDTVLITGTHGGDESRVTAIMLVTGDPAFLGRLMQIQPGRGPQNPGLPGDILGGGVGNRDEP